MNEKNNTITLTHSDLERSLGSIFQEIHDQQGRVGLPRVSYKDEFDKFEMRLEKTNRGFSVSCSLNNRTAYQLNNLHFAPQVLIGEVMLRATNAPAGLSINAFFQ